METTGGLIDYPCTNTLKLTSGSQRINFGYPTSTLHKEIPQNVYNDNGDNLPEFFLY